jgi:hypothetical protein
LKKTWEQHKGTVYGFVKTLLVLLLFIFIKRGLQKVIPLAWQMKIRQFLL